MFHLVVIEVLWRRELSPELCSNTEDRQNYAHNGHEESKLDLVTKQYLFNIYMFSIYYLLKNFLKQIFKFEVLLTKYMFK